MFTLIVIIRKLVEIWIIKIFLRLDRNEEHGIGNWLKIKLLVIKWQRTSLNYVYSLGFSGRKNLRPIG